MTNRSTAAAQVLKIRQSGKTWRTDILAAEEPLEIRLEYGPADKRFQKSISITMRTPDNDRQLALGFLWTEGIIRNSDQVHSVEAVSSRNPEAAGNAILVRLQPHTRFDLKKLQRHFYTSSSCGVCGKSSIEAVHQSGAKPLAPATPRIAQNFFFRLPGTIRAQQPVFEQTGGLHAAGLFDQKGQLLLLKEDVGRHNALDKLIGSALEKAWLPLSDKVLLLSGRISFELVQKALLAGIPLIAAVGAPSTLAIQLAKSSGMTVIGFLKATGFNVYSGEERIIFAP